MNLPKMAHHQNESSESNTQNNAEISWQQRTVEILLIIAFFGSMIGLQTPEANEAHYLAKAKHYWNPTWCPEDFFLNSGDAHELFYWTIGWLTLYFSLPTVAIIGRITCWALLAVTWQRLSYRLLPYHWVSCLTAILWFAGMYFCHMAGEWVIGGVEAKCIAYAFVLWGVADAFSGKWNRAWVALGIASAFHVLVGGWSVVALFIAWAIAGKEDQPFLKMLPGLILGGLISLFGLVPVLLLSVGQVEEITALANWVYVYQRLSHHLLFHKFRTFLQVRYFILVAIWIAVLFFLYRNKQENHARDFLKINSFAIGAISIAFIGILIDQVLIYWLQQYETAAALLRFYWYRLSDVAIPLALALSLPYALLQSLNKKTGKNLPVSKVAIILFLGLWIPFYFYLAFTKANNQGLGKSEANPSWINVCSWISENTEADAIFLTPRFHKTFKWYAHRAEVFNTKDVPQDAANIVQWQTRRKAFYLHPYSKTKCHTLGQLSEEHLRVLQKQHAFDYVVLDRRLAVREQKVPAWSFPKVYPLDNQENYRYEVYRVTPDS